MTSRRDILDTEAMLSRLQNAGIDYYDARALRRIAMTLRNCAWCESHNETYQGWNGANEGSDSVEFCANCGTVAGGTYECDCQRDNVVVNRFLSTDGVMCELHGNWLQVPESYLAHIG